MAVGAVCASTLAACAALQAAFGKAADVPELELRNDLAQAVNVYLQNENGRGEVFLRLVDAGAVDTIRLRGLPLGRTIRLRATTVSGAQTVERESLVVGRTSAWHVRAQ
jgi:hypothetical protein